MRKEIVRSRHFLFKHLHLTRFVYVGVLRILLLCKLERIVEFYLRLFVYRFTAKNEIVNKFSPSRITTSFIYKNLMNFLNLSVSLNC